MKPWARRLAGIFQTFLLLGSGIASAPISPSKQSVTAAEDTIGERLFLDTRFAEFFGAHMAGVNEPLALGDPAVAEIETSSRALPGAFAGESVNCRSCHFVTEFLGVAGAGNRTYCDFTAHSPFPRPLNGFPRTARNAMQMVGSMQPHEGPSLLHFDGEFANVIDLVEATLTGRNFGWAPDQYQQAVAHIARVIRQDDGSSELAKERTEFFSYSQLFLGTDPELPAELRIPAEDRLDVRKATDQQVLRLVAKCVGVYTANLRFQQDDSAKYIGSPYDLFLRINHLPEQPASGEDPTQYNQHLLQIVMGLSRPQWVDERYGRFRYHSRPFRFGPTELSGLMIFLRASGGVGAMTEHAGNCAGCHPAPHFTDFVFHNTGVAQEEYDSVHGEGSFARLEIPSLAQRNQRYDSYLPLTAKHPNAAERFRRVAAESRPDFADLGLWNVYLNPDMPGPQEILRTIVCGNGQDCSIDQGLAKTIARFKTPSLRDLEDSEPYFHNGSQLKLKDAVRFYLRSSRLAKQGRLRNAPVEFQAMSIAESDVRPLAAFLASLTEDYDDK